MSAFDYNVIIESHKRGECAASYGEFLCQLPRGHEGPHRDGHAEFHTCISYSCECGKDDGVRVTRNRRYKIV
jgi:hypothetical protein